MAERKITEEVIIAVTNAKHTAGKNCFGCEMKIAIPSDDTTRIKHEAASFMKSSDDVFVCRECNNESRLQNKKVEESQFPVFSKKYIFTTILSNEQKMDAVTVYNTAVVSLKNKKDKSYLQHICMVVQNLLNDKKITQSKFRVKLISFDQTFIKGVNANVREMMQVSFESKPIIVNLKLFYETFILKQFVLKKWNKMLHVTPTGMDVRFTNPITSEKRSREGDGKKPKGVAELNTPKKLCEYVQQLAEIDDVFPAVKINDPAAVAYAYFRFNVVMRGCLF